MCSASSTGERKKETNDNSRILVKSDRLEIKGVRQIMK